PELASHFETSHRSGALISNVVPSGPAAQAGIRSGDLVLSIDGEPVREGRDLLRLILRQRVGDRVPVEVLRNGRTQTLSVVLRERPNHGTDDDDNGPSRSDTPSRSTPQGNL